jgi:uncharacterized protein
MNQQDEIIRLIRKHYPNIQAIYGFGSAATGRERPGSDVDIAVLLPPAEAKKIGSPLISDLRFNLETLLGKEVDLINLRRVPTVLQKEVIAADSRIYEGDRFAAEEFEMLTLSYYQNLNEERAEILAEALAGGRFHQV